MRPGEFLLLESTARLQTIPKDPAAELLAEDELEREFVELERRVRQRDCSHRWLDLCQHGDPDRRLLCELCGVERRIQR